MRARLASLLNAGRAEPLPHFLVERLLLDGGGYLEGELLNGDAAAAASKAACQPANALAAAGMPVPAVEAMARYDWVARTLDGNRPPARHPSPDIQRSNRRGADAQIFRARRSSSS